MNKKIILALTGLAVSLIGCNSGSTPVNTYLPSGNYAVTITNVNPPLCEAALNDLFGTSMTSDGNGQIYETADPTNGYYLNIANNPCLSEENFAATLSLTSCSLNNNTMNANVTFSNQSLGACTANLTLQQAN